MMKSTVAYAAGSFLLLSVATLASCASSVHGSNRFGSGDDSGLADDGGGGLPDGAGFTGSDAGGFMGGGTGTGMCKSLMRGCSSNCSDFPTAPVVDPSAPANAASLFSGSGSNTGGPCISDPQEGTLIPQNWLRPRFAFSGASGQVYQITLTSTRQASPLVAYTGDTSWTLPKTIWDALRGDSWGDTVNVKICAVAKSGGSPACSTSSFTIAPASAGGSMIYWAAIGPSAAPPTGSVAQSWLEGFAPGDESVATTLAVSDVQAGLYKSQNGNTGPTQCIGCHSAVPDGESVAFVDAWPWPTSTANVKPVGDAGTTGQPPSWLTTQGGLQLSLPWLGTLTFSKTDWLTEKVAVTTYGCPVPASGATWTMQQLPWWTGATCENQKPTLMWTQLDATTQPLFDAGQNSGAPSMVEQVMGGFGTTWGFLARTGDPNPGVEFPNWSHDGTKVVYVSTDAGEDGRLASGKADLYTVPFNNKQGGMATAVSGASDPNIAEYYPAFSEDDQFIAFDLAKMQGPNGMYFNEYGEIYIIPAGGGTATRLAANDPVACPVSFVQNGQTLITTPTSPGVTNSWPKWSPDVESCPDGNTYYWIVFSSARLQMPFNTANWAGSPSPSPDGPTSQLYMTGVSVDGSGKITTYPALYIWNQPTTSLSTAPIPGQPQSNHTPVWETITIPRHPNPVVN